MSAVKEPVVDVSINGNGVTKNGHEGDIEFLLGALISLRKGDFNVRLPNAFQE